MTSLLVASDQRLRLLGRRQRPCLSEKASPWLVSSLEVTLSHIGNPHVRASTSGRLKKRTEAKEKSGPIGFGPPPCPGGGRKCATCLSGLGGRCHTTNVVYGIVCELCEKRKARNTYIGEAKKKMFVSALESISETRGTRLQTPRSAITVMTACHPDLDTDINKCFRVSILRTCKDGPDRKVAESFFIRDRRPFLNTQTTSWPIV